jgi:hypothetical protein
MNNRGIGLSLHIQSSLNIVNPLGLLVRVPTFLDPQFVASQLSEITIYFLVSFLGLLVFFVALLPLAHWAPLRVLFVGDPPLTLGQRRLLHVRLGT